MRYKNRHPITIVTPDGEVRVTGEHPFLTPSGFYIKADSLEKGSPLVGADGETVDVLDVVFGGDKEDVFNFEVGDLHTYVAAGLRVHNIKHEGGMIHGHDGEEIDETLLAGEYVLSPEAVNMVGPENLDKLNGLARMMKQQHYPNRA
jgi:hypothetical protein